LEACGHPSTAGAGASGRVGPTLLGRIGATTTSSSGQSPQQKKAPGIWDAPEAPPPGIPEEPLRPMPTPLGPMTPAAQIRWPFTPIATPSPSARFAILEQLRLFATPIASRVREHQDEAQFGFAGAAGAPVELAAAASPAKATVADVDDDDDGDHSTDGSDASSPLLAAPQAGPSGHPSVGSADHAAGTCRRCCFFPRGRCMNGYDCQFCHYEHEKPKRKHRSRHSGRPLTEAPPQPSRTGTARQQQQQQVMRPSFEIPQGVCWVVQQTQSVPMGMQPWPLMMQQQQQQQQRQQQQPQQGTLRRS